MQRIPYLVVGMLVFAIVWAVLPASAGELRLPPFTVNGKYLNEQIVGDTLGNGVRRDSNAVYVLTRGGLYYNNAVITNQGWPLSIKANDSATTARPVIFLYKNPVSLLPPGQLVSVRGNLTLNSLIIGGYDELDPTALGGLQGALFNTTSPGNSIIIDNCILTNTNGNHIRTDQAPKVVKVTNTVFANMGYLGRSNLGAGKAIDVRAGSVDSLILVNNTFVNYQDRIIRHYSSTANLNYVRFDHNTVVNGMSYHGLLSLGRVGKMVIITNNLLYDAFALGSDTDATRQVEFSDSGEKDAFGGSRMTWVISNPNDTTSWNIRNNYYVVSDSGQAFWANAGANPALWAGSPLTYHINGKLGADSSNAFKSVTVKLGNIPNLMTTMMRWYRASVADSGAAKTKSTTTWKSKYDYDRRGYRYFRDTLDCTYPTASGIYTAASGGYPVGDLNWYPARKTAWLSDPVSTGISTAANAPARFELDQNYPNPFNPSTRISFGLGAQSRVTLQVFDILGRLVATLMNNEVMPAGRQEVVFNASNVASGMYFYRVTAGTNTAVRKMMLIK